MIGYLQPLSPSVAETSLFRTYQCGLCSVLEQDYGFHYRIFAKPDLVFFNLFLDVMAGAMAPVGKTPCPLTLGLHQRDARVTTEHTHLAAAFGVYMAVEKLRDDWEDEGSWMKGLAYRALQAGHTKAKKRLMEAGFPVTEIEGWMATQAATEKATSGDAATALAPTRTIAALSFGFAGRSSPARAATAAAVGAEIGSFLFWMDNLLDAPSDQKAGRYNALVRSGISESSALANAQQTVENLASILPGLTEGAAQTFLEKTLVRGFADKLRRFQNLSEKERKTADLPAILPPRFSWQALPQQATFVMSLAVLAFFPTNAWAQRTTGALWPLMASGDTSWERMLNTCFCSHCCANICDNAGSSCGDSCSGVCSDACS